MKPEIERAMREVIEAWETPDSPEAFAGAMYQMKRVYRAAVEDAKSRKSPVVRASILGTTNMKTTYGTLIDKIITEYDGIALCQVGCELVHIHKSNIIL
jgi:hypothetical protein